MVASSLLLKPGQAVDDVFSGIQIPQKYLPKILI